MSLNQHSYASARASQLRRINELINLFKRSYGRKLRAQGLDVEDFILDCERAGLLIANYAKQHGFNGFRAQFADIVRIWAYGYESTGKTFNDRNYRIVIMTAIINSGLFLEEMLPLINGALLYDPQALDKLATAFGWMVDDIDFDRKEQQKAEDKQREENKKRKQKEAKKKGFKESWNDPLKEQKAKLLKIQSNIRYSLNATIGKKYTDQLLSDIIPAFANAQKFAKARGFNGYLYLTESLRNQVAPNVPIAIITAHPEFIVLLFQTAAVNWIYNFILSSSLSTPNILETIRGAMHGGSVSTGWLATEAGFLRYYPPKQQQQQTRIVRRANEWAYKNEAALPSPITWYSVLYVSETAGMSEIKKSYQQLAKQNHPDMGGNPEAMIKINAAYSVAKRIKERV